jgi:hypothetical protein
VKFLIALVAFLLPTIAWAHPHIWLQQAVRVIAKDGQFTHVEIEWRFDPYASEIEIPLIDEDKNGKFSKKEIDALGKEMMPELQKYGFLTWLNVGGGADIRPPKLPAFEARIADPPIFTLPDWDRNTGDNSGTQPMPSNKTQEISKAPQPGQRNLVYVMRFELPKPTKTVSVTTFDPDDFMRVEVDKAAVPAQCKLAKHPTYKAEYVRGYPVFADQVSCTLP